MRQVRRATATVVLVFSMLALNIPFASTASADCGLGTGHFCAFKDSGYITQRLHSAAGAGSTVDVADNVVSSAKNGTGNHWCGRDNVLGYLYFDFAPNTNIYYVGDPANDRIDYFTVSAGVC